MGQLACACCSSACDEEESLKLFYLVICPACEKKILESAAADDEYDLILEVLKNGWLNVH